MTTDTKWWHAPLLFITTVWVILALSALRSTLHKSALRAGTGVTDAMCGIWASNDAHWPPNDSVRIVVVNPPQDESAQMLYNAGFQEGADYAVSCLRKGEKPLTGEALFEHLTNNYAMHNLTWETVVGTNRTKQ